MVKARKLGVVTPLVYYVESEASSIYMERVAGRSVKEVLLAGGLDDGQVGLMVRDGAFLRP